jgi:nicotinamide riboside transporter PnuC
MIFRFKECWWVWLANNIIDLAIWSITAFNNGPQSVMMLFASIGFLLINIYGIFRKC